MDQRLFCPHCQGAYEETSATCQKCGGAVPDEAWAAFDQSQSADDAAEGGPEFKARPRDPDED
jgi:DnaJ-class molecular chaperone